MSSSSAPVPQAAGVPEAGGLAAGGFLVARSLVPREVCNLVRDYVLLKNELGQMEAPDDRITDAPRLYGDALTEALLLQKQDEVGTLTGYSLAPSYSYLRLHGNGASMPKHTDRDASELGCTINMGGDQLWPLWFRVGDRDVSVELDVGDAALYHGRELPHWREPYEGIVQVQCMLFFVRQDGEFAGHEFDGRERLGT